jgi:origin recognition complex subunit 2
MKRRQPDSSSVTESATPKKRRTGALENGQLQSSQRADPLPAVDQTLETTPSRKSPLKKHPAITEAGPVTNGFDSAHLEDEDSDSATPKANGDAVFRTPQKSTSRGKASVATPSRSKRADRSAKRKSANAILVHEDEEDWEGENALAQEILGEEEEEEEEEPVDGLTLEEQNQDADGPGVPGHAETPSKKGRGRPKGSKNKRSPTPEGDIPPEER